MKISSFLLLIPSVLFVYSCKAQGQLSTKEVFIYRNGFAYVHNTGKVNIVNGETRLTGNQFPMALFGSIWLNSDVNVLSLKQIVDTSDVQVGEPSIEQLLRNNEGKTVALNVQTPEGFLVINGTVERLYKNTDVNAGQPMAASVAVIKTASGEVVITRALLSRVVYAEFENTSADGIVQKKTNPAVVIRFSKNTGNSDLDMVYLCKNPSWMPSYRLNLSDNKSSIDFGAEIGSGELNLNHSTVHLVEGSPEVYKGGMLSLLAGGMDYAMRDYDNDGVYEAVAYDRKKGASASVETGSAEDYYVHTLKDIDLGRNNSARVNISAAEIKPTHVFKVMLPGVGEYYTHGNTEPGYLFPVTHFIEFKNPFSKPMVSAPVFIETEFEKGSKMLLGQPVVNAVPQGGLASVAIAQNSDLPVTQIETEEKRISNAYNFKTGSNTVSFDQVSVSSVIHLENTGLKSMTVKIERQIQGTPAKSDQPWEVVKLKPVIGSPNSNNMVSWNIALKPGEKKDIRYSYDYFLRLY